MSGARGEGEGKGGLLVRLGTALDRAARAVVPDPFVLALLLTLVVLVGAVALGDPAALGRMIGEDEAVGLGERAWASLLCWRDGFWEFLAFGMQMCLILAAGAALATSPPVMRQIERLASLPRSSRRAVALVGLASALAGALSWGFGLMVGAMLAREVARRASERGVEVHYPLLAAAGYVGMLVWHGGLSGSAPLLVATPGHFLEDRIGIVPVGATIGTWQNLVLLAALVVACPLVLSRMVPSGSPPPAPAPAPAPDPPPGPAPASSLAARLEHSRVLGVGIALLGLAVVGEKLWVEGPAEALDLDLLNMAFLFLGLALHGTPAGYVRAFSAGARACSGIILQFPFYAGIFGVMKSSGLIAVVAGWVSSVSSARTLPLATFLTAGAVNLFVPSGGGQWGVQGPVVVEAAEGLGAHLPRALMGLAYGDEWTNMLQPFWALPLLALTGLRARDIMGYTAALMLVVTPLFVLALLLP